MNANEFIKAKDFFAKKMITNCSSSISFAMFCTF